MIYTLRFITGWPSGVLRERQRASELACDGERGYARRPSERSVQQLPGQVARFVIPAYRPDYYYPSFGDDGVVQEMAPTLGKFYAKASNARELWNVGNSRSAIWITNWPTSDAACTELTPTIAPHPPPSFGRASVHGGWIPPPTGNDGEL